MASRIVSDIKLLRKALKIGCFLGVFPSISSKYSVIWYVYSLLLGGISFILYTGLFIYYLIKYFNTIREDFLLDYVDVIMLIVFSIVYIKTSLKQRKPMDKLLNNLSKMARLLTTNTTNANTDNGLFYFLFIMLSVLWISVAYFSYSGLHYFRWYVSFSIYDTYNAVWIYCHHQICSVIRSSFVSVGELVEENFPQANLEESISANITTIRTWEQSPAFKRIVKINVLINDSVRKTNSIFGGMILVLFCKVFINIINAFNYQLYMINRERPIDELLMDFPYIFQGALLLTFAFILIRASDDVQNAHVQVLTACRKRLANMEDKFLTKELIVLGAYMENLPPNFTAAGFFRITRGLMSSFCSTLIAYLIVILQFKLASKNEQGR